MKEPKKTYVGAAVFFERAADDRWPEDSCWPERPGGSTLRAANYSDDSLQEVARTPLSQFVKSVLRGGKAKSLASQDRRTGK